MDKQRNLALTKAQAGRLLPILRRLQTLPDLKPEEAERILTEVEDRILTPAQLKWLDTRRLELERERRARQGQGLPQGGQGGQAQQGQGQGMFQALLRGEAFNPFRSGPAAETLKELIARLEGR